MSQNNSEGSPSALIQALRTTLLNLIQDPYPHVPNPPSCKKRASVALIVRIRPHFNSPAPLDSSVHSPENPVSSAAQIESFFAQEWVQRGDPEVAFIKRAARVGDRWTSHVALPGGKRDPEDADDRYTAIRETSEEIGLDLTTANVVSVGNLPERVISSSWGKVP
jgi:8-oxo-dGTP pyrophosphatase MutT (NUDIX family)